jgi:FixJ family two-component response regulator
MIFISDYPDVAAAVHIMKVGAREVFTRPVDPAVIVDAIS